MFPKPFKGFLDDTASNYYLWLIIEWLAILGIMITNIVFLILRSCFRHKLQLDKVPAKKQIPNQDTILALKMLINIYMSFQVPCIITTYLARLNIHFDFWWINLGTNLENLGILFVLFVHWRKGPECWLR